MANNGNVPRGLPGFFKNARNVDARDGTFNYIEGSQANHGMFTHFNGNRLRRLITHSQYGAVGKTFLGSPCCQRLSGESCRAGSNNMKTLLHIQHKVPMRLLANPSAPL